MVPRTRMLILAATLPFVAGCGVYLHSPALETSTAAVKTSFGALSAPAYLEQQQQRVEQFAAQEDRAVAEFNVASRDYSLLNILDTRTGTHTRASNLEGAVESLLRDVVGTPHPANASDIIANRFIRSATAREAQSNSEFLAPLRRNYGQAQGTSTRLGCAQLLEDNPVSDPPAPPAADPQTAKMIYGQMLNVCRTQTPAEESAADCAFGFADGNLRRACDGLATLRAELTRTTAHKAEYQRAIKALGELIDAANRPREDDPFLRLVRQAKENPTIENYREVLQALDSVLGSKLTTSLNQLTQAPNRLLDHPVVASTRAALATLQAIDGPAGPSGAPGDQPSALLIGLAKVRHDLNVLQVDIDRLQRLIALKQAETDALRLQIHYLARAQLILYDPARGVMRSPDPQKLAEALSHYVSAFDAGLIPYETLRSRELQVRRLAAIRAARATEADYRALLQPAIDQLAAYGAGGVRPDALAPFLASLPVTGAILGR